MVGSREGDVRTLADHSIAAGGVSVSWPRGRGGPAGAAHPHPSRHGDLGLEAGRLLDRIQVGQRRLLEVERLEHGHQLRARVHEVVLERRHLALLQARDDRRPAVVVALPEAHGAQEGLHRRLLRHGHARRPQSGRHDLCTRGIVHSFRPSWGPSCTIFAKSHKLITDYGHYELNS